MIWQGSCSCAAASDELLCHVAPLPGRRQLAVETQHAEPGREMAQMSPASMLRSSLCSVPGGPGMAMCPWTCILKPSVADTGRWGQGAADLLGVGSLRHPALLPRAALASCRRLPAADTGLLSWLSAAAIACEAEADRNLPVLSDSSADGARRHADASNDELLCRHGADACAPNTRPLTSGVKESCQPRRCVLENCSDAAALPGRLALQ